MILAEGPSDERFLSELITVRKLPEFVFEAKEINRNGKSGFAERLRSLRVGGALEDKSALLIVADNDVDPAGAFKYIQDQIRSAELFGIPAKPRELVSSSAPLPSIAVLMIPWDNIDGCLETLLFESASTEYPKKAKCVEEFVKCAEIETWKNQSLSKSKITSMIACVCEEDPATSLKYIWSRKCDIAPVKHSCFDQIATYLSTFA